MRVLLRKLNGELTSKLEETQRETWKANYKMTEPIVRELGNKLLHHMGRTRAVEVCKDNKWEKVLAYIESKEK